MAMIDVVRFDGLRSRDWLIYKYPSEKLVLGTQLIVQEGQIAMFVKGGTIADVFYPGTYTPAAAADTGKSAVWRQNPIQC